MKFFAKPGMDSFAISAVAAVLCLAGLILQ